jgi:hypothetical protein
MTNANELETGSDTALKASAAMKLGFFSRVSSTLGSSWRG